MSFYFNADYTLNKVYSQINPAYQFDSIIAFVELFVPLFVIVFPYLSLCLFIGFYPMGILISVMEIFFDDMPRNMVRKAFHYFLNERPILLLFDLFLMEACVQRAFYKLGA